jgi:UDP-GlcNAc3NAcA epimerase
VKLLTVVGARPQFVKAAPVSHALKDVGIEEMLIHTGQHFDTAMSQVFFDELNIPSPCHNLEIHGGGHGEMSGRMMIALEPIFVREKPDAVMVYGDTNSTLAGALTASKLHLPVIHVEAGLRSFNRRMPEETNRVLTDHVSQLLLCPTTTSVRHLAREGITRGVHHVGDVMYDATLLASAISEKHSTILATLGLAEGKYALATIHRAENTDNPAQLRQLIAWLLERAAENPIVLPLHPRTALRAKEAGLRFDSAIKLCDPVGYVDMSRLLRGCSAVYTDSGGLQKEAYFHRKRCVTLREETEWVETIDCGWNRLWKTDEYLPRREISDYGNGKAAQTIANLISTQLSLRE